MTEEILYNSNIKKRLDSYLTDIFEDMSRSHITGMIREGLITVNGNKVKAGYSLCKNDLIEADIPDEPVSVEISAENIPLDIVYEDNDVIVVNKPKDMVVHPAAGHSTGTLVNALMYHCKDSLSGINGELRPGIVHRIDKDTTGLIIACKNDNSHNIIASQLKEHSITRRYIALVCGSVKEDEGVIDKNIGRSRTDRKKMAICSPGEGRNAVTHYKVLERFDKYTLIECRLETGRTHQIRVHMKYLGCPILGDSIYNNNKSKLFPNATLMLHSYKLKILLPNSNEQVTFRTKTPERFLKVEKKLKNTYPKVVLD